MRKLFSAVMAVAFVLALAVPASAQSTVAVSFGASRVWQSGVSTAFPGGFGISTGTPAGEVTLVTDVFVSLGNGTKNTAIQGGFTKVVGPVFASFLSGVQFDGTQTARFILSPGVGVDYKLASGLTVRVLGEYQLVPTIHQSGIKGSVGFVFNIGQ